MDTPTIEILQRNSRDRAFYAYGTSRIFERRAERLAQKRKWITFLGIVVPVAVGGVVLSFGAIPKVLPYLITFAGVVGITQLILTVWSLVARWDERYSYAVGAVQVNTRLFNAWDSLAKRPPPNLDERVRELEAEDHRQEQMDVTQHITDQEKRFAMRAALYYRGVECATCNKKPASMVPTDCDTCGNF